MNKYKTILSIMFLLQLAGGIVLLLQVGGWKLLLGVFLIIAATRTEMTITSTTTKTRTP